MKTINQWTRQELLSLPVRAFENEGVYDSLLILPTLEEHDSGWGTIAIIGVKDHQPTEIATNCSDDIEWRLPAMKQFGDRMTMANLRMDCALESGAMHAWFRGGSFKVGLAINTIEVELIV